MQEDDPRNPKTLLPLKGDTDLASVEESFPVETEHSALAPLLDFNGPEVIGQCLVNEDWTPKEEMKILVALCRQQLDPRLKLAAIRTVRGIVKGAIDSGGLSQRVRRSLSHQTPDGVLAVEERISRVLLPPASNSGGRSAASLDSSPVSKGIAPSVTPEIYAKNRDQLEEAEDISEHSPPTSFGESPSELPDDTDGDPLTQR